MAPHTEAAVDPEEHSVKDDQQPRSSRSHGSNTSSSSSKNSSSKKDKKKDKKKSSSSSSSSSNKKDDDEVVKSPKPKKDKKDKKSSSSKDKDKKDNNKKDKDKDSNKKDKDNSDSEGLQSPKSVSSGTSKKDKRLDIPDECIKSPTVAKETTSTTSSSSSNKKPSSSSSSTGSGGSGGSGGGGGGSSSSGNPPPTPSTSTGVDKPPKMPKAPKTPTGGTSTTTTTPSSAKARSSRDKRRRRTITFKKTVAVTLIPGLDTYSQQETITQWYQVDEYGSMEDECDMTSEFLEHNKPLWPSCCARGLEAWTTAGEMSKERHVQLAIDIVWQAQLEQWKESHNPNECWEFIRGRYIQVSKPCHQIAHKIGLQDEADVQSYLSSVKSVEKNRRRMLGLRPTAEQKQENLPAPILRVGVRRTVSDSTSNHNNNNHQLNSSRHSKNSIGRSHSDRSPTSGKTPRSSGGRSTASAAGSDHLRTPGVYNPHQDDDDSHMFSRGSQQQQQQQQNNNNNTRHGKMSSARYSPVAEDETDTVSSSPVRPPTRKIVFQKKSKSKIPLSPVGSLVSAADSDNTSTTRRLRSHMSVCSEDSTRRRMLRTASIKEL